MSIKHTQNNGVSDAALAERLRQLRKQAGLSQKALAERLGISGPAVAQWEMGRHRPDMRWLPKLSSLLNCQPSDLRPDLFPSIVLDPVAQDATQRTSYVQLPNPEQSTGHTAVSSPSQHQIDWSEHADLVRLDPVLLVDPPNADIQPNERGTDTSVHPAPQTAQHPTSTLTLSPLQLRRARQQRRLERRELAALLHVDAFKIQQWEQGAATPNEWQAHRLAQVLGLRQSQPRAPSGRVKFTVLQAPNAVRVPILPIYDSPPAEPTHMTVGHMPAQHAQATLVFRLPADRWATAVAASMLHVQVSPCQAKDLPIRAKAVRVIEQHLCLRQRICLEGQSLWFAPASQFGAAQTMPLQPDEWVWRVWAIIVLDDDERSQDTDLASEWHAYT